MALTVLSARMCRNRERSERKATPEGVFDTAIAVSGVLGVSPNKPDSAKTIFRIIACQRNEIVRVKVIGGINNNIKLHKRVQKCLIIRLISTQ